MTDSPLPSESLPSPSQAVTERLGDALRWALDTTMDASMAAADWLAQDVNPRFESVLALLTSGEASLAELEQAKSAFKTMRLLGETSEDRRLGARLYLAAIAAALVQHRRRISRQSDTALLRALERLNGDQRVAQPLQHLAGSAICALREAPAPPTGISAQRSGLGARRSINTRH